MWYYIEYKRLHSHVRISHPSAVRAGEDLGDYSFLFLSFLDGTKASKKVITEWRGKDTKLDTQSSQVCFKTHCGHSSHSEHSFMQ